MVTILASHDRIFYLLAPLLYWLLSSREVIFTVQGSRTACITQSLTHTSGCPVRRFLRHMYVSPWVTTPLMLPSRPSLPKAWPTIPPHFVPASILQDIKISTYRLVLLLLGHVVGHWQGVRFMSALGLDVFVMHHPPLPFIWRMRTECRGFQDNRRPDFHRPMEIGKVFRVSHHETQPSCELNMSE